MRVGVGLPSAIPGTPGDLVVEWARRADGGPFASVGVLERVAYDSFDPFVALSAAAAVTSRIGLVTMVAIGPLRTAEVLAKQAASVDALSRGRLVLGVSIGARADDYDVPGIPRRDRGRRLAADLQRIRDLWEDERHGPSVRRDDRVGPPVLVGGLSGQAFVRMARSADGYVHGGGPPRAFASAASRAWAAWRDLGRPGAPLLYGQGYFALGSSAEEEGTRYLRDYYAFSGPFAERIAAENLTTLRAAVDFVRGYEDAGCDELVLLPTVSSPDQVERLAEVLG